MSNISELANVPQISFIENMTLLEADEQLKAEIGIASSRERV